MNRRDLLLSGTAAVLVFDTVPAKAEGNTPQQTEKLAKLSVAGRAIIQEAKHLLTDWAPTDWITETYDEPSRGDGITLTHDFNVQQFPNIEELAQTGRDLADKITLFTNARLEFFRSLRGGDVEDANKTLAVMRETLGELRVAIQRAEQVPNIREFMSELNGWKAT